MPTAAPAPKARMPLGDVTALATCGVKNRSRKLSCAIAAPDPSEVATPRR